MTEPDDDVMAQTWCCLTCSTRLRFGELRLQGGAVRCPRCESVALHPAGGETVALDDYVGPVGTLN